IFAIQDRLRPEFPGILSWAIEGCLAWQRGGLNPPAIVREATNEYFEGEDSFHEWLLECCERKPGNAATSAELFKSWREWSERAGEEAGSAKSFSQTLDSGGFTRITIGHAKTRGFAGLRLLDIHVGRRREDVA
ncbi:MAG: DNA primase, partial [Gemmatimonadota bacterium]|nr:DNA primase [Gemmatimonadota bacterium]